MKNKSIRFAYALAVILVIVCLFVWNTPGVKSRRMGKQCDDKYTEAIRTANSSEADLFRRSQSVCYTNIARDYQNTQLCDQIQDEGMKGICYTQVYYWNKPIEFCEGEDQSDVCYHVVSVKHQDKSICEKISNIALREACMK